MLILGIETATEQVSVALGGHEGVIALFEVGRGRRHAEIVTPAIDFICAQSDIGLDELGLIAVDVGPGLFTGMRVGLSTAKALAQALRIPMIGISSLDLLAFPHRRSDRVVVPVIDARKGEVFYAMYRQVPGGLQQVVAHRSARSTSSSPTCSPAARRRCASATGRSATAPRSSTGSTARSPTSPTRRRARSSSSPMRFFAVPAQGPAEDVPLHVPVAATSQRDVVRLVGPAGRFEVGQPLAEVLDLERLHVDGLLPQERRPADDVAEFAHVAWPGVGTAAWPRPSAVSPRGPTSRSISPRNRRASGARSPGR